VKATRLRYASWDQYVLAAHCRAWMVAWKIFVRLRYCFACFSTAIISAKERVVKDARLRTHY
jgi:hypothetical protein